jgi:hypothetical protein
MNIHIEKNIGMKKLNLLHVEISIERQKDEKRTFPKIPTLLKRNIRKFSGVSLAIIGSRAQLSSYHTMVFSSSCNFGRVTWNRHFLKLSITPMLSNIKKLFNVET